MSVKNIKYQCRYEAYKGGVLSYERILCSEETYYVDLSDFGGNVLYLCKIHINFLVDSLQKGVDGV